MISIEQAIERFQYELPEEIQLTCQSPEVIAAASEIESTFHISPNSIVIYFAIGELDQADLVNYIKRETDADDQTAQTAAKQINDKILNPLIERIDFLNDNPDKKMTIVQEKNYLERMFKSGLLRELNQDPLIAFAVNRRLFYVLAHDTEFHKKLEQMLYENDELVTGKPLTIDNQNIKPTVSGWIKDFISHYGSQSFDSVSLSSFLINSENARHLSDQEREAVSLVLKVYTNIKFFPDSMPEDETGESWQIIPFDDVEKELAKAADQIGSASQPLKPVASQPAAPQPVSPSAPESSELLELKNMLLQYPAGSLERAAIEEEIKKFSQK